MAAAATVDGGRRSPHRALRRLKSPHIVSAIGMTRGTSATRRPPGRSTRLASRSAAAGSGMKDSVLTMTTVPNDAVGERAGAAHRLE